MAGPTTDSAGWTIDITDLPAEILATGVDNAVAGDGIDDRPALDAAIAHASAMLDAAEQHDDANSGHNPISGEVAPRVVLPEGVFHTSGSIVVDAGIHLIGAGRDLTTLTHTDDVAFTAADITDREVDVRTVNRSGYLIDLDRDADGAVIADLTLRGPAMLGGVFAFDADDLTIRDARFEQFVWTGLRTFNINGFAIDGNHFVDAGGRQIKDDGTFGKTGGGIFATFTTDAEVSNNRFEITDDAVNYFGIKGRKWTDSRIHHNTIETNFSIELPFENDARVEIDHNDLRGVISVPKFAGGPDAAVGQSFHIHHNYFTDSYSIEGARNGLLVESNVFEFDINDDGGNLFVNFGKVPVPGPMAFRNNIVVNPGRGLFATQSVHDNVQVVGNHIVARQTITPRDSALLNFRDSDSDGNTTDYSTITIADNVIEVLGRPRPLVNSDASGGSNIFNNTLIGISDTDRFANPDSGQPRGQAENLRFVVGADEGRTIDGAAVLQNARDAAAPASTDRDGDGVIDVHDPAADDPTNGLNSILFPGGRFGSDFNVADGTSPRDPAVGAGGINVNPDAYLTFYADDPYGVLSSADAAVVDGRLTLATNNGDSFGERNDNADGYGWMVNASQTGRFEITSVVVMPEGGLPQAPSAAIGIQIGTGTQESYVKLTRAYGGGGNRFEVRWDDSDQLRDAVPGNSATRQILTMSNAQAAAPQYQLALSVDRRDPANITVTPRAIALDAEGQMIGVPIVGTTFTLRGTIADAINGLNRHLPTADGDSVGDNSVGGDSVGGVFAGVYATDFSDPFNRVPSFIARWDDFHITSLDPTPPRVSMAADSDTGVSADSVTRFNNDSPATALAFDVAGVDDGDQIELWLGETRIGSTIATGDTVRVVTDGQTRLDDGPHQLVAKRSVSGYDEPIDSAPLLVVVDTIAPTAALLSPRGGIALDTVDIIFSEPVVDFGIEDIDFSRDGVRLNLDGLSTFEVSPSVRSLRALTPLTRQPGQYQFASSVVDHATGDAIDRATDVAGNPVLPWSQSLDLVPVDRSFPRPGLAAATITHDERWDLEAGGISMDFVARRTDRGTLLSKDHRGFGEGGHLNIRLRHGQIEVRLQSTDRSYTVRGGHVVTDAVHRVDFRFGPDGMQLSLDGQVVATDAYDGGLSATAQGRLNVEDVVIGSSKRRSDPGLNNRLADHFDGVISDVRLVDASDQLLFAEALTPRDVFGPIDPPPPADPVMSIEPANRFNGVDGYERIDHSQSMALTDGFVQIDFRTFDADRTQALFSKDARGFDGGGHLTARLVGGRIEIRLQDASRSYVVRSGAIRDGQVYRMRFEFGGGGMRLFVDGRQVDQDAFDGGIQDNDRPWFIGAGTLRSSDATERLQDYFFGDLGNFRIGAI